jgi:hypothetical protein
MPSASCDCGSGKCSISGTARGCGSSGEVASADPRSLEVRVTDVASAPAYGHELVLVQALAKGDRDEQAIEMATELGVDVVIPWQAERSVSQWRADKAARGRAKWEAVVTAATKQSRRWTTPLVRPLATTEEVCRVLTSADLSLVLHEEATERLNAQGVAGGGADCRRCGTGGRHQRSRARPGCALSAPCRCGWARRSCGPQAQGRPHWRCWRHDCGGGVRATSRR